MKYVIWIFLIAAVPVLTGALNYVDEGFEGAAFPPAGWTTTASLTAYWDKRTGGPWGNYALGSATSGGNYTSWAQLDTYPFVVGAGKDLYYRFDCSKDGGGFGAYNVYFQVRYAGTGSVLGGGSFPWTGSSWGLFSCSANIPTAQPVFGRFYIYCGSTQNHWAGIAGHVDNVLFSDAPFAAVAPASLGRVKAVFR